MNKPQKTIFKLKGEKNVQEKEFVLVKEFRISKAIYMAAMPYEATDEETPDNENVSISFFKLVIDADGEHMEYVKDEAEFESVSVEFKQLIARRAI